MSKQVPWEILVTLISRFPQGATLEEVMIGLTPPVPRRTIQRWLSLLVKDKKLIAVGKARARRYQLPAISGEGSLKPAASIPLSKEGEKIHTKVTQQIQKRQPIGYNREFLEKYVPNDIFYLPSELRKNLSGLMSARVLFTL